MKLAPLTTTHASIAGNSIDFEPTADGFCVGRGTYKWKVAGRTLSVKLVKNDCTPRVALMTATSPCGH